MKILAIDPATKCGWAHSCGVSGTWDLSTRTDESKGMKLIRLNGKLKDVLSSTGINLVVFEAARHAAPGMQRALVVQAELQGVIKLFCEHNRIEYQGISPSEIKKFATGKGNANKAAMIKSAYARGWKVADDNEADARFLLEMVMERYKEAS